jgi:threonine dehydrogenase-like Zn-dependent dehydrogenase
MVSSYHAPAEIKPGNWLSRGISLLPSIAYTPREFEAAIELIANKRIDAGSLVNGVKSFADVQPLFDSFETQNDAIKILIEPALG